MATVFQMSIQFEDAYGRIGSKRVETEVITGADVGAEFLEARGTAVTLIAAFEALSEAQVLSWSLGEKVVASDSVVAGANLDEGITLVLRKLDNAKGIIKVPAPLNSVLNADGTVDILDALVTAYTDHFEVGGGFTFSDGENQDALLSGRLDR